MEVSIFDVIGNGISNEEINNVIKLKLHEKYGKEFVVKMIGNRYGMDSNDTVTTFCSPQDNEKLLFTAILNKEQTILKDDYILRSIKFELEESIEKVFKENNVDVLVRIETIGINRLEEKMTVQECIDKFENFNFLAYVVIKGVASKEVLQDVYKILRKKYKNIYLKNLIYMLEEEDFDECFETIKSSPVISIAFIEQYVIKDEAIIKIIDDKVFVIK